VGPYNAPPTGSGDVPHGKPWPEMGRGKTGRGGREPRVATLGRFWGPPYRANCSIREGSAEIKQMAGHQAGHFAPGVDHRRRLSLGGGGGALFVAGPKNRLDPTAGTIFCGPPGNPLEGQPGLRGGGKGQAEGGQAIRGRLYWALIRRTGGRLRPGQLPRDKAAGDKSGQAGQTRGNRFRPPSHLCRNWARDWPKGGPS